MKTGACEQPRDLERVVVDTTVQPKASRIPPTRGSAIARWNWLDLAQRHGVPLLTELSPCGQARRDHESAGIAMPTSSNGRGANSGSCAFGPAGRDPRYPSQNRRERRLEGSASPISSPWRCGCAFRITASAAEGLCAARPEVESHR